MSTDFLNAAIEIVTKATEADRAGNYTEALPLYISSLERFTLALKYEQSPERKKLITQKMSSYMERAEELKRSLEEHPAAKTTTTTKKEDDGVKPKKKEDDGSKSKMNVWQAAARGELKRLEFLLATGTSPDERGWYGMCPLHRAAEFGQLQSIKILLEAKANANMKNSKGNRPIHMAANGGHLEVVKHLVEVGSADISLKNNSDKTALDVSKAATRHDVTKYLTKCQTTIKKKQQPPPPKAPQLPVTYTDPRMQRIAEMDVNSVIKSSGGRPLAYSMLLLVGEGRAGKTGLRNALLGKSFEQTDSTLGIAQDLFQIDKNDIQVGAEAKTWRNFDRKNHQEQQEAMAMVLAETLNNSNNSPKQEEGIQRHSSIEQYLVNNFGATPVRTPSNASETREVVPAPTPDEPIAENEAIVASNKQQQQQQQDVAAVEAQSSFKIDENLVLKYWKGNDGQQEQQQQQQQEQEPLKLTMWDFGGQEVFYSMHHLFLKRFGVYLVVFNMEWMVPQASAKRVADCLDLISFWLRSIKVHTQSEHDRVGAPVFLVGTHKDIVADIKDHEHINKILFEHFGHDFSNLVAFHRADVSSGRGKLWFYPVDNTKGDDRVLLELMKDVEDTVRAEEYIKCKVPFEWMAVCDRLQRETRKSMPLTEFEEICRKECGIKGRSLEDGGLEMSPEDEVQLILRHLSNLGMLMYHSEAGLGDLVVTNPVEFLVGAASKIICDHEIHFQPEHIEAKKKKESSWGKMTRYGIVSSDLMKLLWSNEDYVNYTDELELLMVKFGLIVAIVDNDDKDHGKDREYFVPSLLDRNSVRGKIDEDDEQYHEAMKAKNSLTFFIAFGMKTNTLEWKKTGVMTRERVEQEGFLPHGILCRLIGKAVSQSQLLCDDAMDLTMVKLKGKMATGLSFGDHEFSLREMRLNNVIRVDVHVDNLMVVMSSLQTLAQQAVSECVPNLEALISAGFWEGTDNCCVPSHFILVYGPNGLHDRVCHGNDNIPVLSKFLGGQTLQSHFQKYLPPMGELSEYDAFISYRWGDVDSDVAQGLFYSLSRQNVKGSQTKVFLDKQRLPQGKNFVEEFMIGMMKSRVVVLIVSLNALRRMVSLDCDRSDGGETRDNVLVEWTLALQLEALGKISRIHPILVGELYNDDDCGRILMSTIFSHKDILDNLPDKVSTIVVNEVSSFLSKNGLKETEWLKTTSIKGSVKKILDHLGTPCWDIVNAQGSTSHGMSMNKTDHNDDERPSNSGFDLANLKVKICRNCSKDVMKAVKEMSTVVTATNVTNVESTNENTPVIVEAAPPPQASVDEKMQLENEKLKLELERANLAAERAKMEMQKELEIEKAKMEMQKQLEIEKAKMQLQLQQQKPKSSTCSVL